MVSFFFQGGEAVVRNIDKEDTLGFIISGLVSDLICEANQFKIHDGFDLSDLHSQLACFKQLAQYKWKTPGLLL